ncbi:MAG: signal peptide peptidase SppA [Gammaproteobacteria bacterium]|nr:MAG: signal peptide peptidase SppA [Gammaproteobacteria bacterium]
MNAGTSGPLQRALQLVWTILNRLRQLLQLLLLLVLIALIVAVFSREVVRLPDQAALVLAPVGVLVEQLSGDPVDRALAEVQGAAPRETRVQDLVDALEHAAGDERIPVVVLSLGELEGGGLSKLQEVAAAIDRFRESGKPVIAMGDAYTQDQYYLAAHADELYLHEFGAVWLEGFGRYRAYFREALDKLRVDVNVFRVGEYKSFVEPFLRDDMSEEDRRSSERWLRGLWQGWLAGVRAARGLPAGSISSYIDELATRTEAAGGDLATVAKEARLVDRLISRHDFNARMVELVGEAEDGDWPYSAVTQDSYLAAVDGEARPAERERNVGLLVAAGEIVDGDAPPGQIGGDTLARLVRQAIDDERVAALVMRVDSPGGSMFASERVLEELQALRASGKPLVVSMSSVAASGGYYISMSADEIWASPATITGSIGVFSILPTFQRSLEGLGVRIDGVGTTRLSGQVSPARELGPDARRILQASVEDAYRIFTVKVADARDLSVERVESIAGGRVWTGEEALELGLVDRLGGLDQAIASAARLAGLAEGEYGTVEIEAPPGWREELAQLLAVKLQALGAWLGIERHGRLSPLLRRLSREIDAEWRRLAARNDPRDLYLLCPCDLR